MALRRQKTSQSGPGVATDRAGGAAPWRSPRKQIERRSPAGIWGGTFISPGTLVDASLEHNPRHRQRQNTLIQVTLGQAFCVLPADRLVSPHYQGYIFTWINCDERTRRYLATA